MKVEVSRDIKFISLTETMVKLSVEADKQSTIENITDEKLNYNQKRRFS